MNDTIKCNFMKTKYLFFTLFFFVLIFTTGKSYAQYEKYVDVVYLKNGSVIRGTIIEQIPNESLKIQTRDKNIFVYKFDELLKMTKELDQLSTGRPYAAQMRPKSAGLAFLWSFLFPGGGQYYNGQHLKGAVMSGVALGSAIALATTSPLDIDYNHGYEIEGTNSAYTAFAIIYVANSLWSMIDAPINASRINKENFGLNYRLGENINMNLKPDYYICSVGVPRPTGIMGAKLSFNIH